MKVIADISYNSEILETFLVKLGKIRMPVNQYSLPALYGNF